MADAHVYKRFTVHMQPVFWWQRLLGASTRLVVIGIGSSVKDGELLITTEHGTLYYFNLARVLWMEAEVIG